MDLEALLQKLAQTDQGDLSLKDETAVVLCEFISHQPPDLRPGVMCFVEATRICAPEPPIPIEDLPKVFRIVIDQLWLVHEPAKRSYVAEVMEKLDIVHGYLLLLEAPERILEEIFATILQVFHTPIDDSSVVQIQRLVVKMVICLLNEADEIPPSLLHRIFQHIAEVGNPRIIVRSVLRGLKERAVSQINRFVQTELLPDNPASQHAAENVLIRIYEAYKVNPDLVRCALPVLANEMRLFNSVRRIVATELVGRMALLPDMDGFLPKLCPPVWDAYMERFKDVADGVRESCTKHVLDLAQNHPSSSSTEQVLERCEPLFCDKSKTVRLNVVSCVSYLARSPQYINRVKKFLPELFRRCRDKQPAVRAAALTGSVDIYNMYRNQDFVGEVPSHVFASLFLYRDDKRGSCIEEECAERLFEPASNGEPACVFALCSLDNVAQNGLVSFSQRKSHARHTVLRLLQCRKQILTVHPSVEASLTLASFREFCPTITDNAMRRFLSYHDDRLWDNISQWVNESVRLSAAEAHQTWNTIVSCLRTTKAVKRELTHVLRLSGAHLFICPDDIPRVLSNTVVVNMLSLAAPYCFMWHLPQLCARPDNSPRALQRVALYAEKASMFPLGVNELPQEFVDRLMTTIIRDGQAEAVACLVFTSVCARSKALKHLLDLCDVNAVPLDDAEEQRAKQPRGNSDNKTVSDVPVLCDDPEDAPPAKRPRGSSDVIPVGNVPVPRDDPQKQQAAKQPWRNHDAITVNNRLKLAAALASSRFLHIDDATREKLKMLALAHAVEYAELSWVLLGELGCVAELLAYGRDEVRVLPMLLNALTKDGVTVKAHEAIAVMGVVVRHPGRQQFLGDIHILVWKTHWKPTFALVLMLSAFALKGDNENKNRRGEALELLIVLLRNLPKDQLRSLIIGFIAALHMSVSERPHVKLMGDFFARAYVAAKQEAEVALEACRAAIRNQDLRCAANVVIECMAHAFEHRSAKSS